MNQFQGLVLSQEWIFILSAMIGKKTLSLQDQMIQDVERGHIDKELIKLSAKRIIDFKKQIPIGSHGKENLLNLANDHLELIQEMKSHLP